MTNLNGYKGKLASARNFQSNQSDVQTLNNMEESMFGEDLASAANFN